jgi:glycerol-3-phosphate dehydrogenase (NAD(P)+)
MGLSGLGDLLLTATSLTSRNARFGHELGCGRRSSDLLAPGQALSEGAYTTKAVCRLAARVGVEPKGRTGRSPEHPPGALPPAG